MVYTCMVLFCKSRGKTQGLLYFSLTSKRYSSWMNALGRNPKMEKLSHTNVICSEHFADEAFMYDEHGVKRLKPDAVPTLKLGPRKPMTSVVKPIPCIYVQIPSTSSNTSAYVQRISEVCLEADKNNVDVEILEKRNSSGSSLSMPSSNGNVTPLQNVSKREFTLSSSFSDSGENTGPAKKIRRNIETIQSASPQNLSVNLDELKRTKETCHRELLIAEEHVTRLTKKITQLKNIVAQLKANKVMSDDSLKILEESFYDAPLE